ncbi:MAG: uncharacterized protein PWQ67_161 [Clostridia bacterium]|jgi:hypothetical protein|nr:uncharacterized protein [Clostridia bacterium]MDN5321707.1 uncharacterized protein [Clostridia bacterium]
MIKAVIYRNTNDYIVGFEVSGHAEYAEIGKDIVCAAVSILATTTVNSLEEQLSIKPQYNVNEADGHLQCYFSSQLTGVDLEKAQVILKTMEIGFISIEQEYSKYFKLLQRRWTKC